MEGVLIYIIIGLVLFTPIGFIAGYLQHQKDKKKEEAEKHIIDKQTNQH